MIVLNGKSFYVFPTKIVVFSQKQIIWSEKWHELWKNKRKIPLE